MKATAGPGRGGVSMVLALLVAAPACGALRQNLKNQFVSYRGAWHCPSGPCRQPKMVRATQGHRDGDVKVSHVKLDARAALVFYPGTPAETFTAKISCGGQTADVPQERLRPPGQHKVQGQADAWVVLLDPADYEFGDCGNYRITTHSTWDGGKREYDEPAGIQVQ